MIARRGGRVVPALQARNRHVHILQGIAGDRAALERVGHALHGGVHPGFGPEPGRFPGIGRVKISQADGVARASGTGRGMERHTAVMLFLAQFPVELGLGVGLAADGFPTHHLRAPRAGGDAVFATDALQEHVQMQFAHAGNHTVP